MNPDSGKVTFMPVPPTVGSDLTSKAHVIIAYSEKEKKFSIIKNRYGGTFAFSYVENLVSDYLGIKTTYDGHFITEADHLLFLLKYAGIKQTTEVASPIT